ncbi:MAG: M20/M25/M40 family metallo-hydrolase [Candidatus Thorarchaeota archaeon]
MKPNDTFANKIKGSNEEFIKSDLVPFLRVPSDTLNKKGILQTKDFLVSYISEFCVGIKEFSGEINPIIIAKVEGNSRKSLLIYMMYDTQPISKENQWISDPFMAEVHNLSPPLDMLGECIIARGAYNSKTPLICFLNVVKELKKEGELPISLILVFDGEEELGSPSLLEILENNQEIFKDCIDAYYPSTKQNLAAKLVLKLGYKGILLLTIKISTNNKEPHSAFSGMIPNPALDLISLLSNIYANNKFLITSLGKPYTLSKDEQLVFDELIKNVDIERIKKKVGILQTQEADQRISFKNYLFNPTFNISTLKSGFMKEGTKNYVPNEAICKVDIRFANEISEDVIFNEIKEKVELFSQSSNSKIELIKNMGYNSSRVPKDSIIVRSLIKVAKKLGFETELWPISAAAAPLTIIQNILGLKYITGGLGIGGGAHSVNEFIQYDSIINTRLSNYYFLKYYAQMIQKEMGNII